MNKYDSEFTRDLLPGEVIQWTGKPRQGIYFQTSDVFLIPFSLMWGGFSFFWEYQVYLLWKKGGPIFMLLFGIPFVAIGLYLIFFRFFWEAFTRKHSFYAVTNQRILIKKRGFSEVALTCIEKQKMPELESTRHTNGRTSISFGPKFQGSRRTRHMPPAFEQIEDGDTALKWINEKR